MVANSSLKELSSRELLLPIGAGLPFLPIWIRMVFLICSLQQVFIADLMILIIIKFISSKQIRDKLNKTRLVDRRSNKSNASGNVHNYIFQGDGNYFTNRSGEWIPDDTLISNGSAYADLDNDGDLDLIVNNYDSSPVIYRNKNRNPATI